MTGEPISHRLYAVRQIDFTPPSCGDSKRAPPLSPTLLGWPLALWRADPKIVLDRYGAVDAYVFLRFLRMLVRMLVPIWVLSWAILMPVDAVETNNAGNEGLDRFTFGNISPANQARYAAHLVLLYVFTGACQPRLVA